jgi:hypothetical protein
VVELVGLLVRKLEARESLVLRMRTMYAIDEIMKPFIDMQTTLNDQTVMLYNDAVKLQEERRHDMLRQRQYCYLLPPRFMHATREMKTQSTILQAHLPLPNFTLYHA